MGAKRTTRNEKSKSKGGARILVIVLIMLIIVAGVLFAMKIVKQNEDRDTGVATVNDNDENEIQKEEVKTPKTFAGNTRPIAFMIDNNINAMPQAGLQQADLIYEMIVEGGETRLMIVMKDKDVSKVGPLRSSRHNFLDYALENDAIYVHYGWSPQAESDISSLGVNNINGITEASSAFPRQKDKSAPHNVATTIESIKSIAERKKYRTTSAATSVLHYVTDEVELADGQAANKVTIPYSESNEVEYIYNAETARYQRYSRGVEEKDWATKELTTTKNIIITFARNTTLNDGENKGRQTLYNVGTLKGYYITNGKAIEITCEKSSRSVKTVYKDLNGKEIDVNDGNTFVQICPINANVTME